MKPAILLALLAVVGIAAAQTVQPIQLRDTRVLGLVPADRWTYVHLASGGATPDEAYTVPSDRYLVVTSAYRPSASVRANGVDISVRLFANDVVRHATDSRVVMQPGTVLTALPTSAGWGEAHIWGYLEPLN